MKRALATTATLALTLVLTACGSNDGNKFLMREFTHTLGDGRVVTCLNNQANGSIDCDWENAK